MSSKPEADMVVLKKWHLIIAILSSIVVPSVTATAAFYQFQLKQKDKDEQVSDRINRLELNNQKSFAEKSDVQRIEDEVREIHDDVIKLKTYIERRL